MIIILIGLLTVNIYAFDNETDSLKIDSNDGQDNGEDDKDIKEDNQESTKEDTDKLESSVENDVSNPSKEKKQDSNNNSPEKNKAENKEDNNNNPKENSTTEDAKKPSNDNNDGAKNDSTMENKKKSDPESNVNREDDPKKKPKKKKYYIINSLNRKNMWKGKTVYLTFDDGPSWMTENVLDILKERNIKSTFFVTGTETQYGKDLLKRIVDEGHSIGNHTYSHNYRKLYSNPYNFLEDFYKNEEIIYNATGIRPKIMRFPGGSNNNVHRRYSKKGFMHDLDRRVKRMGYVPIDWNASSGDASEIPQSPKDIINNTLTWANREQNPIILFHDSSAKLNTLKALPTILDKLIFLGCDFKVLTEDSFKVEFLRQKEKVEPIPKYLLDKYKKILTFQGCISQ